MRLRYTNPAALTQDIQIPGIQVEPMAYNGIYTVVDALGYILLTMPHWEEPVAVSTGSTQAATGIPVSELRRIKGIGAKIAGILAEKNISTLTALVSLTAQEVDTLLDGTLDYVTVEMIQGWQEHARQLMED